MAELIDSPENDMNSNSGIVNFIMLGRIYDLLMLIADAQGKGEEALELFKQHQNGFLIAPLPALAPQADMKNVNKEDD
jgi:hypothetical protein